MRVISLNTRWGIKMKPVNDTWFRGGERCTWKAAWFIERGRGAGRACFFWFLLLLLMHLKLQYWEENNTGSMLTSLNFTPALQHVIVREGLGLCVRKIVQSSPLLGWLALSSPHLFAFLSFPPTCSSPCQLCPLLLLSPCLCSVHRLLPLDNRSLLLQEQPH